MSPCCASNVVLACEAKDEKIAALEQDIATSDIAIVKAQRDLALDYLRRMVQHVSRLGGHAWPPEQAMVRGARALLAENGVRVKEEK
jgi:hypothetical protein